MNFKYIITASFLAMCSTGATAQKQSEVQAYIAKYKTLAIAEQKRTGVPAAIKLAQGIHESGCGNSELSLNAKNHFGIKCKTTWTGLTYTYTDDAKDECFRKYDDDFSSYRDHSDFLKNNKRYASLFVLDVTDYKSWAQGLKKCGYATNPKYAQRIVDLVEKYELNQYSFSNEDGDYGDDEAAKEVAIVEVAAPLLPVVAVVKTTEDLKQNNDARNYYVITVKNGLKGFYGRQGDLLLNAAYANNIRYGKLLELNDLADEPLPEDMFIYMERKRKEGKSETYSTQEGERLITVAQEQGIRLKELRQYNHLKKGEEVATGTVLYLKNTAPRKPLLSAPIFGDKPNPDFVKNEAGSGYVAGGAKPATKVSNAVVTPRKPQAGEYEAKQEMTVTKPAAQEVKVEEEPFNIANEVAVEEQIAAERNVVATRPNAVPEAEMSDLDRLKAKLDKSVYGSGNSGSAPANNTPKPAPQPKPQSSTNNPEVYQTRPASAGNTPTVSQSGNRSTATGGGGVESLKRRIEAHQNDGGSEPVVANKSNVATVRPAQPKAETKAKPKAAAKKPTAHTVKKGETATAIAGKYGLTVKELVKLNKLPANGAVKVGQQLKLK